VRKSRFSEEKMVAIQLEADRSPTAEVAKKHGISELSFPQYFVFHEGRFMLPASPAAPCASAP
jgi:hypothetical protein